MRPFTPKRTPDALYGVTAEKIAELWGVHICTARRWMRGEWPSLSALKVIALHSTGDLGGVDPRWSGWSIRDGELVTPDGAYQFSPGDVQAIPFRKQLIRAYQDEQALPRQADWISGRWVPTAELAAEAG